VVKTRREKIEGSVKGIARVQVEEGMIRWWRG